LDTAEELCLSSLSSLTLARMTANTLDKKTAKKREKGEEETPDATVASGREIWMQRGRGDVGKGRIFVGFRAAVLATPFLDGKEGAF
jgi:hypothetical protein